MCHQFSSICLPNNNMAPFCALLSLVLLLLPLFRAVVSEKEEAQKVPAAFAPIFPFNIEEADQNGNGKVSLAELRDFVDSEPFSRRFKMLLFDANGGEIPLEQVTANLSAEAAKFAAAADKAPKNGKLNFVEWKQFICMVSEQMLKLKDTDDGDGLIIPKPSSTGTGNSSSRGTAR